MKVDWDIELSAPLVNEVSELFGLDLMSLDANPFRALARDVALFIDVLFVLLREQANERGLTSQQFGESFTPTTLKPAADALCNAVITFRPSWNKSERARKFLTDNRPLFAKG